MTQKRSNSPAVSIIVPTHNAAGYIDETLRSLDAQSLAEWEVIFVDDASKDDTAARVQRVAENDSRVRLFESRVNMGQNVSRNIGLSMARAPMVKFLDHDDLLPPWALETQVAQLKAAEADLVIGSIRRFEDGDEGVQQANDWFAEGPPEDEAGAVVYPSALEALQATTPTFNEILVRTELMTAVGFNRYLGTGEELDVFGTMSIVAPDAKIVSHEQPWVMTKRCMDDSLGAQLIRGEGSSGKKWGLLSLEAVAERILDSGMSITDAQRQVVFDRLYKFAAYAYRDGLHGPALTSLAVWERAGLPKPEIGVGYHDHLHKVLGFRKAEAILSGVRKIRNTLTGNHQNSDG